MGRLVTRYRPLVYAVAVRVTKNHADAEDVTQDVFMALPQLLREYEPVQFTNWLKEVTRRRALLYLRAERRHPVAVPVRADALVAESDEQRTLCGLAVERALRRLEPALRTVFLLHELEGYSHDEIAGAMGGSTILSRVRLYRARESLRRTLAA